MKNSKVSEILKETETGYDMIADKFSETRKYFWPEFEFIKNYANAGDKVLDFGCGNGRLLEIISSQEIDYYGLDISQKLLEIAQQKYKGENIHFQKISGFDSLPFEDNFFNIIYAIAVFHHLPSRELREKTAKEFFRILSPGGNIFITVWNIRQKKYWKNILKQWLLKIFGKSDLEWNDCYIDFKNNQGAIFSRYYHIFSVQEIKTLFCLAGFKVRECKIFNKKNIILVVQKPAR